jgi:hypothetical protein
MNKNKALVLLLLLTGCMSYQPTTPVEADIERVKSVYPTYTLEQLKEGKALYESKCSDCHGLKRPGGHSPDQWQKIVPRMTAKANKKSPGQITPEQSEQIVKFLVTMSLAGKS